MLVIVPMGEMHAIPVEVGTKTTCKITLAGRKGISENLTNWRTDIVKVKGSSYVHIWKKGEH